MCGFLGVVATGTERERGIRTFPSGFSRAGFARALERLRHRGPDGGRLVFLRGEQPPRCLDVQDAHALEGDFSEAPQVALGHHRLAVIDLSQAAAQPMSWPNGKGSQTADEIQPPALWLVYNGEIYNYRQLRADLQTQGVVFRTRSDTEVLLALYERDGPDMLRLLNGIFAFGIWDVRKQQLFLARDRYGAKPLYYTQRPGGDFAFASETKALLALPGVDRSLDYTALSEHFTFQIMLGDRTLLKAVRLLEPGCYAVLDASSGILRQTRYWDPVFQPDASIRTEADIRSAVDDIRQLLRQAVERQLVGDAPIGGLLSGGMDSGAITAIAASRISPWHTFTAGFDVEGAASENLTPEERLFDEREAARSLAEWFGASHHVLTITPNDLSDALPSLVWHLDDFRAGISYPNYLVNRMARQNVTVALSGVGGDELFAGYPWRYEPLLTFDAMGLAASDDAVQSHYYNAWVRLLSEREKQALFTPEVWQGVGDFSTRDSFAEAWQGCRAEYPLDRAMCFDFKTFLPSLLLVEDRLSMAHGLESRVPFLDNDLVDACLRLPGSLKLSSGGNPSAPATAKWILKEALRDILPEETLTRRKQGFTPPDAGWYRGALRPYIESILLDETALNRGMFRPHALRNLLEEHFSGRKKRRFLIWSLLCLEWWRRRHAV